MSDLLLTVLDDLTSFAYQCMGGRNDANNTLSITIHVVHGKRDSVVVLDYHQKEPL